MKLSRHTIMAAVMLASGLAFTLFGDAHAQRAVYRTVSGHGYGHGCPCPTDCPPADGEAAAEEGAAEDMGEELPEVADLSGDVAMASASQSAAPNAIGDSLYPGFNVLFGDTSLGEVGAATLAHNGGRRFKATHNDSPIPQTRVFFNYNYFDNSFVASEQGGDGVQEINTRQYEFGAEYAIWCDMASIQIRVPLHNGFSNNLDADFPLGTDTEFGNVQLALKAVLCQDCCTTWTAGLGIDLPTADDIVVEDVLVSDDFTIANETVSLSPYLAMLHALDCCAYVQGFAQVSVPVNETEISLGDETDDIREPTLLYLDVSTGYWLYQDCCGNGLVAIGELHYTDALDDDNASVGGEDVAIGDYEFLNATIGATLVRNCWTLTPAVVLPLLDDNDRQFDYEIAVQVNRRF